MGFGGGGGGALPNHEHTNIALDGGPLDFVNTTIASLTANSMTYSSGAALQELTIGSDAQVLGVSGGAPTWITNTSNPLVKVSKTFADIAALEMDIYTLPEDSAICNVWADITTAFDVSSAVTIGTGSDNNGLQESADWTAGVGLSAATRGTIITSYKNMLSTSGTTAIKAYGFSTTGGGGSTFTQSNTDNAEDLYSTTVRTELAQLYQAGQVLIGEDVCKASWFIRDTAGTATGDLKAYIRTSAGVLVATSTTVLDASTVTAGYIEYTFEFPATEMLADYMICLNSTDMSAGSVAVQSYNTDIANGLLYLLESGTYNLKANRSMTGTITYDCTPVTGDTVGAVDFYLQVVN